MGRPTNKPKKFHCCGLSWTTKSGLHYHKVKYHGHKPDSRRGRRKPGKSVIQKSKDLLFEIDDYLTGVALEDMFEEYYTSNEALMFDPDDFFD